ncbi:MAG: GLPGLI family protein [Aquirufa sp.]
MKYLIPFLLYSSLFITQNVSGQQTISVDYKEWYAQPAYISVGTPIFKLVLRPNSSMYFQSDLIKTKSSSLSSLFSGNEANKERNFTIKFYDTQKILSLSEKSNNQVILVSDSLKLIQWKIQKTKSIRYLGLDCYQAKGYFRGRNYTAYFAPKIKKSDGPFKFSGLPGLIIKIASDDNYKIWQAIKINYQEKEVFAIPEKFKGKSISFANYAKMKKGEDKQYIKDYKAKNPPKPGESYQMYFDYVEKPLEIE